MADAYPNSGGPAVDQPGMAKKKKAKAPRKPREECMPEEIAKLDTKSAKRRNRRAAVKDNAAACKFAAERDAMEAARRKIEVEEKEAIVNKSARPPHAWHLSTGRFLCTGRRPGEHRLVGRPVSPLPVADVADHGCVARLPPAKAQRPHPFLGVAGRSSSGGRAFVEMQRKQARPSFAGTMSSPRILFDEMPTPMAPVDNTYDQFMEDVIYNGGHVPAYDPDETQSHDGRAQFVADEEADDRAHYDHGDSWHGEDDIYCEGDGDEDEVNDIDISGEPLFINELTQRAEAQKKKKSIRTGSYTQDEDKLICNSWTVISQDPRTGAQQKGLVFWTRVHKTFHGRKMFEPYQITSDRGITSIQKRWLFIQQESNKYYAALESIEARPVSGLGIGDMDMRDEKKRQSKDEQMKQYLELQRKKLEIEEVTKKRKIDLEEAARQRQLDIEAANVEARKSQLDIEATNAATKAKEVALAIMSVDLTKMSEKMRSWFEARQKEMFDADNLN
ncbi:putative DBINO protein [Hordeum vulgare]|nr:putative DBINO protein [Hordeum vulgare]